MLRLPLRKLHLKANGLIHEHVHVTVDGAVEYIRRVDGDADDVTAISRYCNLCSRAFTTTPVTNAREDVEHEIEHEEYSDGD